MTLAYRVIARLDVKGPNLIKGWKMEGLRVLGNPAQFARRYAEEGADELLFLDTVASLYGRDNLLRLVEEVSDGVFVPITVGGGVRSLEDVKSLLRAGADKVALNTAAIREPRLIREIADAVGSQAVVVSIEAKRVGHGWEAFTDQGRNRTGRDALIWAAEAVGYGAGEILLTSIDQDGTQKGLDLALAQALRVPVPVVVSGGVGTPAHAVEACSASDAVAIGAALHNKRTSIAAVKAGLAAAGATVRLPAPSPASAGHQDRGCPAAPAG